MIDGLNNYLDEKGFASVNDIIGKSVDRVTDWGNLDLNYDVKAHVNNEHCIRCNLCYVACEDGAHQSFEFHETDAVNTRESSKKNASAATSALSFAHLRVRSR
jgi:dihydropyrimidine dehydrogenase (NAD+) subunit PreA